MMKITFMSLNYVPSTGGLVSYIRNLSEHLKKSCTNCSLRIITTDGKNNKLDVYEEVDEVSVQRIRAFKYNKLLYLLSPCKIVSNLKKELSKLKFDEDEIIVIRHLYFAYAASKVIKNNHNKIYIVPLIAPRLQKINMSQVGWVKKLYYAFILPQLYMIEKYALKNINYIGVLSLSKKEEVSEYYQIPKERIKVIYPGVDIDKFRPLASDGEKATILKKLEMENLSNSQVLVTVGRLVSEKNIDFLIDALSNVKSKNFKLIIVGDGPLKSHLERQVDKLGLRNKVFLLGFRTDVELLYRISDVFILPSKYEGFGHVYLEALASGLPCIGLKNRPPEYITATDEIVEDGVNGFVVEGVNPEYLTSAIERLLNDDKLLDSFKKKSRETIERKFTWASHMEKIHKIVLEGES